MAPCKSEIANTLTASEQALVPSRVVRYFGGPEMRYPVVGNAPEGCEQVVVSVCLPLVIKGER